MPSHQIPKLILDSIVPYGIFWMLWPLPSTQWHLRHSLQGLFLFQIVHICWSTLGTEGWGCFTVIFKGEGNTHSPLPRNRIAQDDQLHLVEDQSQVAPTSRTERITPRQVIVANNKEHIYGGTQDLPRFLEHGAGKMKSAKIQLGTVTENAG